MRYRRLAHLVPLLAAVWLWWTPAQAADTDGAVAHVRQLAEQVMVVLRRTDMTLAQREATLRPLFHNDFDLEFIGRFALGKNWARATPEQRADYLVLFGEFVVKTTVKRLGGFVGDSFTITAAKAVGDDDVLALSRVERAGESPVAAGWRVRPVGGRHQIIDISVAGLSLSQARRGEFANLTRDKGVEGLLLVLEARIGRLTVAAN